METRTQALAHSLSSNHARLKLERRKEHTHIAFNILLRLEIHFNNVITITLRWRATLNFGIRKEDTQAKSLVVNQALRIVGTKSTIHDLVIHYIDAPSISISIYNSMQSLKLTP